MLKLLQGLHAIALIFFVTTGPSSAQESEFQKRLANSAGETSTSEDYWVTQLINDVDVPAQERGQVDTVLVREGQLVKKDEIVATLDNRLSQRGLEEATFKAQIAETKANDPSSIEEAIARLEFAKAELAIHEKLYQTENTTATELRSKRAQKAIADAGLSKARMEQQLSKVEIDVEGVRVKAANDAIERRIIRAPFDGLVMSVDKEPKEWANEGDKIVKIVRMDRLRIKGDLSIEQHSPNSVNGQRVEVSVKIPGINSKQTFPGVIVFAKPDLALRGNRFEVWAEIENRVDENQNWLLYP
ncbi:MAG: HlyD family efflux transporter periplasmic adaptor subunit, partial [Pirellulaceae bacterium]